MASQPILFVDVDGVISLFGFPAERPPPGRLHYVDGLPHFIGHDTGDRLRRLGKRFELVWATGWEERANDHLPHLLRLEGGELPWLGFDGRVAGGSAHWKVDAIAAYAGERPAAWIDDNLDESCERWAAERAAPTLLVRTDPAVGMSEQNVERLLAWAEEVSGSRRPA